MDDIDKRILDLLQTDAKASNAELAAAVGLTASSVFERVRKLEQRGVIAGYAARLDPAAVGKDLLAFVRLQFSDTQHPVRESLSRLVAVCLAEPDILESHDVAGEDCVILKVRCSGTAELQRLLGTVKDAIPGARSVTHIVLETFKEGTRLAVAVGEGGME